MAPKGYPKEDTLICENTSAFRDMFQTSMILRFPHSQRPGLLDFFLQEIPLLSQTTQATVSVFYVQECGKRFARIDSLPVKHIMLKFFLSVEHVMLGFFPGAHCLSSCG